MDASAPLYGCDGQPQSGPELPFGELNQTLQCALRGEAGEGLLPKLDQILAGHMHCFETLSFAPPTGRPQVLIVGNSGVAEDTGPPVGAFAQTVDAAAWSPFLAPCDAPDAVDQALCVKPGGRPSHQ